LVLQQPDLRRSVGLDDGGRRPLKIPQVTANPRRATSRGASHGKHETMNPAVHRRDMLRLALATGMSFATASARAHEYYVPTLRISHPWCRATAADAPFAIVCITFDEVREADRLIVVETPVAASAELSGAGAGRAVDFAIPVGRDSVLGEEGTVLRLTGLTQALEVGRMYPLRLVFAKGGEVNATLDVAYASFR
jgi:copper(I)-binding protein